MQLYVGTTKSYFAAIVAKSKVTGIVPVGKIAQVLLQTAGSADVEEPHRLVIDVGDDWSIHRKPVAQALYLVPSQPCSDKSIVTPSGPVNFTSTLPRFAISSVPG